MTTMTTKELSIKANGLSQSIPLIFLVSHPLGAQPSLEKYHTLSPSAISQLVVEIKVSHPQDKPRSVWSQSVQFFRVSLFDLVG